MRIWKSSEKLITIFNCACLESWIMFQTKTLFNTECDNLPIPTFSPSINVSESVSTVTKIPGKLSFPITDIPMTSPSPITNERRTLVIILTAVISILIILPPVSCLLINSVWGKRNRRAIDPNGSFTNNIYQLTRF